MSKRKDSQQIRRLLQDADRDLAKGLTVADICRKHGISGNTYYRWRQRHDPATVDDARRVRDLESEVQRLKLLVAELLLDKQMLRDVAKKVVTATQQRAAAGYLGAAYKVSQRRASQVLGRARSTLRYRRRDRSGEAALVQAIRRLAKRRARFGYKRIHARLVRQGWRVKLKRARRLWNALGLRRPFRRKKTKKLGPKPGSSANSCVNQPARFKNDVWTCDFIADRTAAGGTLKCLSLVDEYTRECLALYVASSITGADVRRVLARVIARRGAPTRLRSDNGSEFISQVLAGWLPQTGAEAIPIAPASPWENGFIESFYSRLRDEFLNLEEFDSAADTRAKARWWRRSYSTIRPHSGLRYKTPKEFSDECDQGLHGQVPKS